MMTVGDLIKMLSKVPKDMPVVMLLNNTEYIPICKDECLIIQIYDETDTKDALLISPCAMNIDVVVNDESELNLN